MSSFLSLARMHTQCTFNSFVHHSQPVNVDNRTYLFIRFFEVWGWKALLKYKALIFCGGALYEKWTWSDIKIVVFFFAFSFYLLSSQRHKSQSPTGDLRFEITELIKYWKYKILDRLQSATPFEDVRNKLIDKAFCTNELILVSCTDNPKSM